MNPLSPQRLQVPSLMRLPASVHGHSGVPSTPGAPHWPSSKGSLLGESPVPRRMRGDMRSHCGLNSGHGAPSHCMLLGRACACMCMHVGAHEQVPANMGTHPPAQACNRHSLRACVCAWSHLGCKSICVGHSLALEPGSLAGESSRPCRSPLDAKAARNL